MSTNTSTNVAVIEPATKPETPEALPSTAIEPIKNTEVEVQSAPLSFVHPASLPDFDALDAGVSLRMTYKEFEKAGQKIRAMFVGMTTMPNGKRELIPAAVFQTKTEAFVNAGANLISQVKMLPSGTPVEIEYRGKEKTGAGFNVKVFDVRVLMRPAAPATLDGVEEVDY